MRLSCVELRLDQILEVLTVLDQAEIHEKGTKHDAEKFILTYAGLPARLNLMFEKWMPLIEAFNVTVRADETPLVLEKEALIAAEHRLIQEQLDVSLQGYNLPSTLSDTANQHKINQVQRTENVFREWCQTDDSRLELLKKIALEHKSHPLVLPVIKVSLYPSVFSMLYIHRLSWLVVMRTSRLIFS